MAVVAAVLHPCAVAQSHDITTSFEPGGQSVHEGDSVSLDVRPASMADDSIDRAPPSRRYLSMPPTRRAASRNARSQGLDPFANGSVEACRGDPWAATISDKGGAGTSRGAVEPDRQRGYDAGRDPGAAVGSRRSEARFQ